LDLNDQTIQNVDDKTSKQNHLKNLNQNIRPHKMGSDVKDLKFFISFAFRQQHCKVDTQVNKQKGYQEQARQSHNDLFGDR